MFYAKLHRSCAYPFRYDSREAPAHRVTTMARFRIMEEEHQAAPTSDSREMATSSTDRAQTSDSGPMAIVSRDRARERKRRQRARATTEEKEMEKKL